MMPQGEPRAPLPAHILRVHSSSINALFFSEDNERLYSGDSSGFVAITSTRNLRPIAGWKAHTDSIMAVQEWESSIVTHGRDNKLHVWSRVMPMASLGDSAADPDLLVPTLLYSMDVNALNFCRFSLMPLLGAARLEGRLALIAVPNLVDSSLADIWSLPSCQRIHAAIGKESRTDLDQKSDGRSGNKTGILMSIHLFDVPHPSISDRSQLRLLAAYEDGSVSMWKYTPTDRDISVEGRGWSAMWSVRLHVESVMAMAVSRQHNVALTASADHLIGRYNLTLAEHPDFKRDECFVAHRIKQPGNGSVTFRDDGRVCAVGGWDGRIRLFSTKSMKPLGTLSYHTGACHAITFAHKIPNGDAANDDEGDNELTEEEKLLRSRWIAAGGQDRKLSIWQLISFEKD